MRGGFSGMRGGLGRLGGGVGPAAVARPGFASPGRFGRFAAARPFAFRGSRFAFSNRIARNRFLFRNRFAFRHNRFFRNRFAFIGVGAGYGFYDYGYDNCYAPVWTPYGWQWTNVCYY
jgi:hypothetical protein